MLRASFTSNAGEAAMMAFGEAPDDESLPVDSLDPTVVERLFRTTARFWRDWISRSTYRGRWREMVDRSALVLKLLNSAEHGSLIAAATFGLPEKIGGERNWDYRYAWLRDSAFSMYAMMRLGFVDEARAFYEWIRRVSREDAEHGPLQVMYRVDGGQELDETTLDSLSGYPELASRSHRQCGTRPAPTRHLWRAGGRRLSVQQVRRREVPSRSVAGHKSRLGMAARELAAAG